MPENKRPPVDEIDGAGPHTISSPVPVSEFVVRAASNVKCTKGPAVYFVLLCEWDEWTALHWWGGGGKHDKWDYLFVNLPEIRVSRLAVGKQRQTGFGNDLYCERFTVAEIALCNPKLSLS